MKNIIDKLKLFFNKLIEKIKKYLYNKNNRITALIILGIIIAVIIVAIVFGGNKKNRFALNEIYNVYPEEVRELYSNLVSVSCYGDLHLDITLDSGKVAVDKMNQNNLLDYLFSHLEKNNLLTDEVSLDTINQNANKLFNMKGDFLDKLNNYQYGDYLYQNKNNKLIREKKTCTSDKQYVTHLYGYTYNKDELSMDVNIGYLVDGVLYDLADNRLGKYSGEVKDLNTLFVQNSYYRFNYVSDKGTYKLSNVEWNSRS